MNNHHSLIIKIENLVKKKLANDSTGHGYWHSYRVVKLALKIGRKESANLKVLELAGWLHDIAAPKGRDKHEINGAKMAENILKRFKIDETTIKQVTSCILKHRYSRNYHLNTIEEKIISDADNLDALGAIIIPRVFAHCGVHKITIHDPAIKPNRKYYLKTGRSTTGINHIYEKLFDIPNSLHTTTAKKIAKPRLKFLKAFLKQYLAEFQGKN